MSSSRAELLSFIRRGAMHHYNRDGFFLLALPFGIDGPTGALLPGLAFYRESIDMGSFSRQAAIGGMSGLHFCRSGVGMDQRRDPGATGGCYTFRQLTHEQETGREGTGSSHDMLN